MVKQMIKNKYADTDNQYSKTKKKKNEQGTIIW